jgi:hypothetical protein
MNVIHAIRKYLSLRRITKLEHEYMKDVALLAMFERRFEEDLEKLEKLKAFGQTNTVARFSKKLEFRREEIALFRRTINTRGNLLPQMKMLLRSI